MSLDDCKRHRQRRRLSSRRLFYHDAEGRSNNQKLRVPHKDEERRRFQCLSRGCKCSVVASRDANRPFYITRLFKSPHHDDVITTLKCRDILRRQSQSKTNSHLSPRTSRWISDTSVQQRDVSVPTFVLCGGTGRIVACQRRVETLSSMRRQWS